MELEQVIVFSEKHDEVITSFGVETIKEFCTIEKMNSSFVLDDVRYVVYQVWAIGFIDKKGLMTYFNINFLLTRTYFYSRVAITYRVLCIMTV